MQKSRLSRESHPFSLLLSFFALTCVMCECERCAEDGARVYWTKNDEGGAARQEQERKTSEKVDAVKKDRGLV